MKLLYVEDHEFEPAEIRCLADISGRSVADVIARIEQLRETVREREALAKGI